MSWISNALFGKDPSKAAQPYLEKIPGMAREQYNPYIQRGNRAYENLEPMYNNMAQNPTSYLDELMAAYSPSQGFQYKADTLGRGLANTAAAGGYRGSDYDQQMQAELINGLLQQDMQQWLQNAMGAQQYGMTGLQGFANQGYDATQELADILGGALNQQAGLAYQGQAQKNQNRGDYFKTGAQLAGTILGGPIGGAVAGKAMDGLNSGGGNSQNQMFNRSAWG